ncbi:flowering time control protein FPA-like [Phragmites australis]|uniref:flowering time control protein FPA-like n=1 Tax=Phragmites australis TaxID=29695 RepID=UPI002D78DC5E|nr:flowering time control protein FPA-like [Phragmites australis]XP_062198687.1 flowering time control protein FPA-like [Phragmites australis]XP_062198689.1 flowering time control protein FPA-like [Phragmites australis]
MSSEPPPADSPEAPSSASPPKEAAPSGGAATAGGPETNTLWVGNLPSHVSEGDVMALFAPHGALDCALARAGSRSYAFVLFRSPAEARAAVEATRGAKVKGAAMRTEFARPARAVKNLWVGGISPSISKEELEEEFQKFGKIEGVAFSRDQTSAYIDFEKLEDAISAHRSLNGKTLGGTELCVDFQRSKGRAEWSEASNFNGRVSGPPGEKRGTGPAKGSAGIRMREAQPTNVLWVGFPGSYKFIDEEALQQAMAAYGVVTNSKVFQSRQYAFVEFARVAEAYNAKKNLDGRLFNDHRIQILFSNSELAPNNSLAGFPRSEMYYNDGRHGPGLGSGTLQWYDPPSGGRPRYSGYGGVSTTGGILPPPEPLDPREAKRTRLDAGADPVRAGSAGISSVGFRHQGSSVHAEGSSSPVIRVKGAVHRTSYLEHFWRGSIAKGGSPVCRARCLPIGKVIDITLPDVINCSARTGLDMLAKHYADATGFEIVFFLPDSEDDFVSYTEFLHYLGSKSRAGVVKVDAGTTLFLVPPSDFLTNVLQVDGPERLYGVVLHIPQMSAAAALRPQLTGPELQSYYDERETVSTLQRKYNIISPNDNRHLDSDYRGSLREDSMHHLGQIHGRPRVDEGQAVQPALAGFSTNQTAGSQVQSSLNPDIMATLAKLMPSVQSSTLVTGQIPMNSTDRQVSSQMHDASTLSKVWKPENQAMASNPSFGQIANLQQPGQQFNRQASAAHLNFGNMVGAQEHSAQHTAYNPEVTLNLPPPPPPIPTLPHSSAMLPSQGAHSLSTQTNQQLYQPEQYYASQSNYGHSNLQVSNANIPVPPIPQVNHGPSPAHNQMGSLAQLQHAMPLHVNRGSQDFSSQGQNQQNFAPGAAQAPEEADKSKKYHATLQLAQSLLLQIQRGSGNQP